MKKILSLLAIFTIVFSQAQWKTNFDREDKNTIEDNKKLSYGYFLGFNYFDFKITPDIEGNYGIDQYGRFTVESEGKIGFSAGLMGKLRLNNYFDVYVQPGIHFTERTLYFNHIREDASYPHPAPSTELYTATAEDSIRTLKSSYVDVPIMIQVHGNRWFNTRPYLQVGAGYAMNLQSQENNTDDNGDGIFRLKTHGFNWQVEGGISIYFRRFKLTPSVKGIFFMNNELVPDDPDTVPIWANSLESLQTRAIMFSLKFE
ncbi:outer membrane beta-barrel protein [Flavobacteriaceae bacterium Ap0902]|nr:outer membrane beta-barrel protein [Flavobacteriaceae bacterium Ap0902]